MNYTNNTQLKTVIGRNILIARKALGISHEDILKLTGITRPVLSSIENAAANPTLDNLLKLSSILKLGFNMIFLTEAKFNDFLILLKSIFEKETSNQADLSIDPHSWKILLEISGNTEKSNCVKVAKICSTIISLNEKSNIIDTNKILCAALGVIYQKDGFERGLNFGYWLGSKL